MNPFLGKPFAEVSSASPGDVDAAVNAAAAAWESWRRVSGAHRGELLYKLADVLTREHDRLARIETQDNGKIIRETRNQLLFAARCYRFFAGAADKLAGETKPLDRESLFDYTTLEPLGVCALITAWNSPLQLLANKLAPALAAGNTVVVKPSEHTSVSTLEFASLVDEAGFPPGVFNVVCGAAETGQALTMHPLVDNISFTGSVAVGSRIAEAAAMTITPVTLELGGKSANIIFEDADLAKAIPGAVAGIFAAAGQNVSPARGCSCTSRATRTSSGASPSGRGRFVWGIRRTRRRRWAQSPTRGRCDPCSRTSSVRWPTGPSWWSVVTAPPLDPLASFRRQCSPAFATTWRWRRKRSSDPSSA